MPDDLKQAYLLFKNSLSKESDIALLQQNWSLSIDRVISSLCHQVEGLAVFALGGYGRNEMAPKSDVDLLFLCDVSLENMRSDINRVIYPLLEAGLDAGGASRTIRDCEEMFSGDVRAQTSMLDARFISGDKKLAEKFNKLLHNKLSDKRWCRKFARLKYQEQMERFRRFGSSVFMLEPNIKEGEGGLRAYHSAYWVSKALKLNWQPNSRLKDAYLFLQLVRSILHVEYNRQEDRLTYERQELLAEKFQTTPAKFMDRFYAATALIHRETTPVTENAAPFFFKLIKNYKLNKIKKAAGNSPSWRQIVAKRSLAARILFYLHDAGLLSELVPSFKEIYHKAQFGAYHVYTVDIHSILSVKRICDLDKNREHPLLRKVYKKIKRKDLLLLSALLHDVGKSHGADHAEKGALLAKDEAVRLGYDQKDAGLVSFLVGSHLLMPKIAFSRDLNDRHLIKNFAESINSIEKLDMLFILTYADINSIGPNVWNSWKEKLLCELYTKTRAFFGDDEFKNYEKAGVASKEGLLDEFSGNANASRWLAALPDKYFAANSAKQILGHIEQLEEFSISGEIGVQKVVSCRHVHGESFSELVIVAIDAAGLFAKIAGTISGNNINILEAELNSLPDGIVLDVLRLQNDRGRTVNEDAIRRLEFEIESVISGKRDVAEILARRERSLKRRAIKHNARVEIDNDVSAYHSVVDVYAADRLGLLYDVALAFAKNGYSIDIAKILTKGDLAQDSFYIKDLDGKKIASKEKSTLLSQSLMEVLK